MEGDPLGFLDGNVRYNQLCEVSMGRGMKRSEGFNQRREEIFVETDSREDYEGIISISDNLT